MWVLGTLAKRWTAACSLSGSIPLSSSRRPTITDPEFAADAFGILTSHWLDASLKMLGKRA